jgi:hypothetical protein
MPRRFGGNRDACRARADRGGSSRPSRRLSRIDRVALKAAIRRTTMEPLGAIPIGHSSDRKRMKSFKWSTTGPNLDLLLPLSLGRLPLNLISISALHQLDADRSIVALQDLNSPRARFAVPP